MLKVLDDNGNIVGRPIDISGATSEKIDNLRPGTKYSVVLTDGNPGQQVSLSLSAFTEQRLQCSLCKEVMEQFATK